MSNTGIKKILLAIATMLIALSVVAVSFAVWDTTTGSNNKFAATGGGRVAVQIDSADTVNTTFGGKLIPDGAIPNTSVAGVSMTDDTLLYLSAGFTPSFNGDSQSAKIRFKFKSLKVDAAEMAITDAKNKDVGKLKADSILEAWVTPSQPYLDRPSDEILPIAGELTAGTKYYIVIRFKEIWTKSYLLNNITYTFDSLTNTYTTSDNKSGAINQALVETTLGGKWNANLTPYQNAPYNYGTEKIDYSKYSAYTGKKISANIIVYAAA